MLIYAVADIHGRAERFANIEKQLARYRPDALVVAGDLANYRRPEAALARLNALPLPVLVVRGNTDLRRVEALFQRYPNLKPLHLNPVLMQEIPLVGLSGTIPVPFRSRIRFREKDLFKRMATLVTAQTVLVAHPPPYGLLDEVAGKFHAGSRRLYDLVVGSQPAFLLCGHIHERPGIVRLGRSIVVNCSLSRNRAGALIEIHPGRWRAATLL